MLKKIDIANKINFSKIDWLLPIILFAKIKLDNAKDIKNKIIDQRKLKFYQK